MVLKIKAKFIIAHFYIIQLSADTYAHL